MYIGRIMLFCFLFLHFQSFIGKKASVCGTTTDGSLSVDHHPFCMVTLLSIAYIYFFIFHIERSLQTTHTIRLLCLTGCTGECREYKKEVITQSFCSNDLWTSPQDRGTQTMDRKWAAWAHPKASLFNRVSFCLCKSRPPEASVLYCRVEQAVKFKVVARSVWPVAIALPSSFLLERATNTMELHTKKPHLPAHLLEKDFPFPRERVPHIGGIGPVVRYFNYHKKKGAKRRPIQIIMSHCHPSPCQLLLFRAAQSSINRFHPSSKSKGMCITSPWR